MRPPTSAESTRASTVASVMSMSPFRSIPSRTSLRARNRRPFASPSTIGSAGPAPAVFSTGTMVSGSVFSR